MVECVLINDSVSGAVNAVSPGAVPNAAFTRALARAMRRPALLPLPAFAVNLVFGEMGREALLASANVRPARLLERAFEFRFPEIHPACGHVLHQSDHRAANPRPGPA